MSDPASPGAVPAGAAGAAAPAWIEAKALWRKFTSNETGTGHADIRIGIAASFTAHNLVQFVGAPLLSAGYRPQIALGPYNQLFQVCLDPQSHFGAQCDAIALLWRIEDLLQGEIDGALRQDKEAWERAVKKLDSLTAGISALRSAFRGMIIVSVPALPTGLPVGPLSLDNPIRLGAFHRAVAAQFIENVSKLEHVRLLDFDVIQREVGYAAAFDARQWYLYRQPFTDQFLHRAGAQFARILLAARQSAKKCVVLDCDNTLWGGVVGEDGIDGIELGSEYPGSAFCDFQRLLLHWRRQGIFLAILSKNNEADVWEVFDKHRGMVLSRKDISAWQINWLPKAENIALIASALHIGLDSLVFIDDSPMEIDYMRQAQPAVTSILLPEDPAQFQSLLRRVALFDRLDITDEDLARVDMVRAEIDRDELGAKLTKQEFLRALELRVEFSPAKPDDLSRVTQLINKTNQFNLTTIRRTLEEARALAHAQYHRIYSLRVWDKFGDYGLTGVVIIEISPDRRTWAIDSLMLSCRVLGRGVEAALVAALASDARAQGATELVGSYVPTKKNSLCATFLPDHGFRQDGERWRLPLAQAPIFPSCITRVDASEACDTIQAA
jgi:FkbH-like protein